MPEIQQMGDTLVANGGVGTFTWMDANEQPIDNGNMFLPSANGTYYLVETAANGCNNWSLPYEYARTGIANAPLVNVAVYPNPTFDKVKVHAKDIGVFMLYGINGKKMLAQYIDGNTIIDISALPAGIYYYEFATMKGAMRGKLVKQ